MNELANINFADYDFLDFGAYKGGSIDYAHKLFGTVRGLGIDIDPRQVETMRKAGYDSCQGDITSLDIPPNSVRFVMISHLLEHLPDLSYVKATVQSAALAASDFLFIQGPFFDGGAYLESLDLKYYWADWTGHPCHLTTGELCSVLDNLDLKDYTLMACDRIRDSDHSAIHPINSPADQHHYDAESHPPKPHVAFEQELYREIICFVRLRQFPDAKTRTKEILNDKKAVILTGPETRMLTPKRLGKSDSDFLAFDFGSRTPQVKEIHKRLLIERGWDFLSYLHLRDALRQTEDVRCVLTTNHRRGYCEIALALEFPTIDFYMMPPASYSSNRYDGMRNLMDSWGLDNLRCGEPGRISEKLFDLTAATEIFDGTSRDEETIRLLTRLSTRYLWLLTGFDPSGVKPWRGYGTDEIEQLLPPLVNLCGCLWVEKGVSFRRRLDEMSNSDIIDSSMALRAEAMGDLGRGAPIPSDCLALWALAKTVTGDHDQSR